MWFIGCDDMVRTIQLSRDMKARITKSGKVTLIPFSFLSGDFSEDFAFPLTPSEAKKLKKVL